MDSERTLCLAEESFLVNLLSDENAGDNPA